MSLKVLLVLTFMLGAFYIVDTMLGQYLVAFALAGLALWWRHYA